MTLREPGLLLKIVYVAAALLCAAYVTVVLAAGLGCKQMSAWRACQ